jgi:hypothetical protein
MTRTAIVAIVLICSTWQEIRTCSSPDGYLSTETQWQDMTFGQDNRDDHWTTTRWQGQTTITIERGDR